MPDTTAIVTSAVESIHQDEQAGQLPDAVDNDKIASTLKSRAETSKKHCREFHAEWKRNVDLRLGKNETVFGTDNDELQSEINPDWYLTKTKTANLYSQVPTVQGTHENKQYEAAIAPFMKAVNYELGEKRAYAAVAMEEIGNDVVNAAGIGFIEVGYMARFESKLVPAVEQMKALSDEQLAQLGTPVEVPEGTVVAPQQLDAMLHAKQVPMFRADVPISYKFFMDRFSPSDGLWPAEFTGSNFDNADYMGRRGKMTWADALNEWKPTKTSRGLRPEDKDAAISVSGPQPQDTLRSGSMRDTANIENVTYIVLYYWRHRVDPDEKYLKAIWKIVWVEGIDKPVIHESWKGQKLDEQRHAYVGSCKFPIRAGTDTYISDNPVPPSDSAAARPQVNDMRRSRSQLFQQRQRSLPIRGYNINVIDPLVMQAVEHGDFQGFIPVNGSNQNAIWEVARASYPAEDMEFDHVNKQDMMDMWQLNASQLQQPQARKTSAESNIQQQSFATVIGQSRYKMARFFLGCVEVLMGWMVLYSDFPTLTDQEKQVMQQAWDQKHILHDLVLKVLPDSTIMLDTTSLIDREMKFLNMTVKSGFVNPKPILTKIAELSGHDPSEVIVQPQPKEEKPNMSFSFGGKDDMQNAMVLALMLKYKMGPSPQEVQAALQLLMSASQPQAPTGPSGPGAEGPGAPGMPPPMPGGPPGQPPVPSPEDAAAHPEWVMASKIAKRSREMSSGG